MVIAPDDVVRFSQYVRRDPSGCHVWIGARRDSRRGYGCIRINGRPERAHRVAWAMKNGTIPDGMYVCHACDNPACVNPDHLWIGDQKDNMGDCARKGRKTRGEDKSNAVLTDDDVRLILHSPCGPAELGRRLGVTTSHVCSIRKGRRWRHVE